MYKVGRGSDEDIQPRLCNKPYICIYCKIFFVFYDDPIAGIHKLPLCEEDRAAIPQYGQYSSLVFFIYLEHLKGVIELISINNLS